MLNAGVVGVLGVLAVNPELVRVVVISCGARRCRLNIMSVNLPFRFAWDVDLEAFCRAHMSCRIYPISLLIFNVTFPGNRQVLDLCWDLKRALPIPGGSAWFGIRRESGRKRAFNSCAAKALCLFSQGRRAYTATAKGGFVSSVDRSMASGGLRSEP